MLPSPEYARTSAANRYGLLLSSSTGASTQIYQGRSGSVQYPYLQDVRGGSSTDHFRLWQQGKETKDCSAEGEKAR